MQSAAPGWERRGSQDGNGWQADPKIPAHRRTRNPQAFNRWSPDGRHRIARLGSQLHALGPRPIAEAVLAVIGHVAPACREAVLQAAEAVAALPSELVEAVDARAFARPPLRCVGGRS